MVLTKPLMNQKTFEKRLPARKIYGIQRGDVCVILSDCNLYPPATIKFQVPMSAAEIYFESNSRPAVQDLFPRLMKCQREILSTGTSPAEFDEMTGKKMPKSAAKFRQIYGPLGYVFDE